MRMRHLKWVLMTAVAFGPLADRGGAQDGPISSPNAESSIRDLRSENVEVRRSAASAIQLAEKDLQREALPVLIELLKDEKDGQVRLAVLGAVTALGPDAAPAVPTLVHTLTTDYGGQSKEELHQDYRSALALAAIGGPAVEGLRALLGEEKINVRAEAAMALGRIGPDAREAVPDLIRLLGIENDRVGGEATLALGRIGEAAVGPLIDAASDDCAGIRSRAIGALGHLPDSGVDDRVRAVILEGARDEAPEVRASALKSLACLELPGDELRPILDDALADEHENVRLAAVGLLVGRRDVLPEMSTRLRALLTADDDGVARHAAFLLQAIGPEAAPALLDAMGDEGSRIDQIAEALAQIGRPAVDLIAAAVDAQEPRVRRGAALALGQIRPMAAGTVETLTIGLDDPVAEVRGAFLEAIGLLGPRSDAVPAIRGMLRDDAEAIRLRAVAVLYRSAPRDERLAADLTAVLDDIDPAVQTVALGLLRSLGPLGRVALPDAIAKLERPETVVRLAAAELIGSHGPAAAEAVPALCNLLDDPSAEVRAVAARTLGDIGKAAQPALPRLTLLLKGQPSEVRTAVVLTLGSLELDAESIRPQLAETLRDEEPEVRGAALRAIQRLGPGGAIFVPDIILLAENREERSAVERSLRRFERSGTDARSVPALIEQLGHEQEAVRLLAIKFLGLAGPDASAALPALEALREDSDDEVRREAEEALERIKGESDPD